MNSSSRFIYSLILDLSKHNFAVELKSSIEYSITPCEHEQNMAQQQRSERNKNWYINKVEVLRKPYCVRMMENLRSTHKMNDYI